MTTEIQSEAQSLLSDLIAHIIHNGFEEWTLVSQICDMTSSSDDCALQANLSLAKQLNRSRVAHKLLRIGRLWVILLHNCGEDFIAYNSSSNVPFLANLETVLGADDTNPGVRERFMRVLASAVSELSHGDPNHPYAALWTKFKQPGEPALGFHISTSDPLLRPTVSHTSRPSVSTATPPALDSISPSPPPTASTSTPQPPHPVQPPQIQPNASMALPLNQSPRSHTRPLPILPTTPVVANRIEVSQKGWNPYPMTAQPVHTSPEALPPPRMSRPKTAPGPASGFEVISRPSPTPAPASSPTIQTQEVPFTPPPPPPTISSSPALLETPAIRNRRSFHEVLKTGYDKVMKKDHTPDSETDTLVGLRYDDTVNTAQRPRVKMAGGKITTASPPSSPTNWSGGDMVSSPIDGNSGTNPELLSYASTSNAPIPNSTLVVSAPAITSTPGLRSTNSYVSHKHHRHSSSTDIFSVAHSGLDGLTLNISVADLCKNVRQSLSQGRASSIPEITWYKEQGGVRHEFLIVKVLGDPNAQPGSPEHAMSYSASSMSTTDDNDSLHSSAGERSHSRDTQPTWLRLDRAARKGYTGFFQLKSSSAIFPANDTAMVSATEATLQSATSRVQARYSFASPPSLHDLEVLLSVIGQESTEYNLFKENCYFFSSVVCTVLAELHQGSVIGNPLHPKLGGVVRQQISNRLRQLSVPYMMGAEPSAYSGTNS